MKNSGVTDGKISAFHELCHKEFGESAVMNPNNLIESKKFELETPEVKISVDPAHTYSIRTKIIDGSKYILIPVGEGVEVNGIDINVEETGEE